MTSSILSAPPRSRVSGVAAIVVLGLATTVLSATSLWRITGDYSNDIIPHAKLAVEYVESGHLFTYSLWYPLIWVATGGGDPALFRHASVALLVLFVVGKALVAYLIAQNIRRDPWSSALIAFGVSFFGPLVDPWAPKDIYLGQITATVWHNSTNIMVAPFALLAFWAAVRLVSTPSLRGAALAGLAAALAIAVKPNFAMAMIPVIGVALLMKLVRQGRGWGHGLVVVAAAAVPPLAVLGVQFASIYGGGLDREETLAVAPFAAWRAFSDNIPWSLVLSLFGVTVALIVLVARRELSREVLLAWTVLGVAIVELSLLAERMADGALANSGNWFWGSYTALMVLALWSAIAVRESIFQAEARRRRILPAVAAAALGLHVATGVYYALAVGTPAYGAF